MLHWLQDAYLKQSKKTVIDGQEVSISASIGISIFPEDVTDSGSFFKHAHAAMYHANEKIAY